MIDIFISSISFLIIIPIFFDVYFRIKNQKKYINELCVQIRGQCTRIEDLCHINKTLFQMLTQPEVEHIKLKCDLTNAGVSTLIDMINDNEKSLNEIKLELQRLNCTARVKIPKEPEKIVKKIKDKK